MTRLSLGPDATVTYGRTRVTLEKRGTPIGPLDTLIAAHALGPVKIAPTPGVCCSEVTIARIVESSLFRT